MSTYSLNQDDLESLADTYDKIRELYKSQSLLSDKQLTTALEVHLRECISELSENLSIKSNDDILQLYAICSKYKMFQVCIDKIAEFVLPYSASCSQILLESFKKLEKIFLSLLSKSVHLLKDQEKGYQGYTQTQQDLEQVLKAAESLEYTILTLQKQNNDLKDEIQKIHKEKKDYVQHLEDENRNLLEKVLKTIKPSSESTEIMSKSMDFRESRLYSPIRSRPSTPPPALHDLTLKQTKDMIEDLYSSKFRYDFTNYENKLPRETFENFISLHFSQKYGLKSLCTQWLNLLSKACLKYENDISIKIFKKIRENELNEEFLHIVKQVREKVNEIVKGFFRTKHPYMQEKAIKVMQEEVLNNEAEEEIWNFVVSCFAGKEKVLRERLVKFLIPGKTQRKGRVVKFVHLLNTLFEVLLEEYEGKIGNFREIFKKVDIEAKGFITPQQLCEVFEALGCEKNVEKCVEMLDPWKSNRIVFSDFVVFCLGDKGKDELSVGGKNKLV